MKIEPRYIFNASAFALGGRLTEPYLSDFTVQAPTTLPTVGGLARAEVSRTCWQELISFDSARSMVRGGGPPPYERVTTASAELTNLEVEGRFRVKFLRMTIRSFHDQDPHFPYVVPDETELSGITIDGCKLNVEFDPCPFQDNPTKSHIVEAWRKPEWRKEHGSQILRRDDDDDDRPDAASGKHPHDEGEVQETGSGLILATLAKSISMGCPDTCRRHGGQVVVKGNVVIVPNFGRIYFGEIIIADTYRRFNAFRLKLGSPAMGDVEAGGVGSNGGGVP